MLPLGEILGPSGPCVATRHGAPSSHADLIKSLTFRLIGIRRPLPDMAADHRARSVPTESERCDRRPTRRLNQAAGGSVQPRPSMVKLFAPAASCTSTNGPASGISASETGPSNLTGSPDLPGV